MRQTNEQRAATERLRALAGGHRVKQDAEGWPMIPGRLGRIEWYCDGVHCHSLFTVSLGFARLDVRLPSAQSFSGRNNSGSLA